MKVLFISHCSVVPRYQRRFRLLAEKLPDFEFFLLVPDMWWEGGEFQFARGEKANNLKILVHRAFLEKSRKQHGHFYPSLSHILRNVAPDIVYLDEEPYSLVTAHTAALLSRSRRRPPLIFCTYENLRFRDMGLSFARYQFFNACRRFVFPRTSVAQAVTVGAAQALRADGFDGPIFVMPAIGYPPPQVLQTSRRPSDALRVGYLGRLESNKGVPTLIQAASSFDHAEIVIGGDGPERPGLEVLTLQLGLENRVQFLGRIPHDRISSFLSNLDVLVLPSRRMRGWVEQYGRVLVEAMSHGVVPVGSDTGAIPEIIGDAGWIFPEGDSKKLAAILSQLFLEEKWDLLRNRAVKRAVSYYSDERIADGYSAIIEQISLDGGTLDRSRLTSNLRWMQ
jgi:glycosyltransferase involved in cell wall biosynthesis